MRSSSKSAIDDIIYHACHMKSSDNNIRSDAVQQHPLITEVSERNGT